MSLGLDIKLRILNKPEVDYECKERYSIPRGSEPLYYVCITADMYIIYDALVTDPRSVEELKKLEEKLYDIIVSEYSLIDKLIEIKDPKLRHIVERQFIGYGVLEPFFLDPDIINVHVLANKQIQVIHRVYDRLKTNIILSLEEVKELAMRLAAVSGKPVSEALPLSSFIEPRYDARVSLVYMSDITMRRDMTIDIRKLPDYPWTILKLIQYGSLSIEEAAFLWLMVKYKVPIIIVGELMTGKTTLATALLSLIPPGSRIMTAEDTPEFKAPSEYWTRTTTREYGEYKISYFDLIKTGVRLSVDYIIVGEIRGEEAREWAHAILLGHGTITTFHAESPEAALLRLLSPPISIDPQVIKMLNVFVKTNALERSGKRVFRHEVYIVEESVAKPLFTYNPEEDRIIKSFQVLNPISEFGFIDRIVLAHRVTHSQLEKEYNLMIEVLKETYKESLEKDHTLDTPTYKELPFILYRKLYEKLTKYR